MHSIDIYIQNYLSLSRTPGVTENMYVISTFFDLSLAFVLVVFCVAVLVYLVRGLSYTKLFLSSLVLGGFVVFISKYAFNVNRPVDAVTTAFGQSFPSYHATIATIFFGILIYIFDTYLSRVWRIIFNIFCISFVLLISFSRIYLGVHWFSDIVGGICLGVLVLWGSITWYNRKLQAK
jgi:undecaprenyl-diphosphatase